MKKFITDLLSKIKGILKKSVSETEEERIARQIKEKMPPYSRCQNCCTELEGMYCHKCGQYASEQSASIKEFIAEYLHITFHLDSHILPTICHLITRPGHLTQTFLEGKIKSYVHPLKLNIFLLFTAIAIIVLFSLSERPEEKLMSAVTNTVIITDLALTEIMEDEQYVERMYSSDRDTINLLCLDASAEKHKEIITALEVRKGTDDMVPDTLLAIIPSVLIEDGIFAEGEGGIYEISTDRESFTALKNINYMSKTWNSMMELLSKYLPIIILLTCPILALVIGTFYRRRPHPFMHYFVFTLHYTAFLEIFLFLLFLISAIINLPTSLLLWIFVIIPAVYLTLSLYKVFKDKHWALSALKMAMINTIYFIIIFLVIFTIFIISAFMAYGTV